MADGSVKIEVLLDDSKVSGGVKKVEGRLSGIAGTAKRGLATVGKLAGALGLVGLAYKGIDMVKNSLDGAIDRYDTLNNFPRVMAQIGFDADTSQKAINKLSDGIQGLPTRLDEVAATAQSIAIMTGDLDGAVDTTLALNNAFLASGASAQDAQRGMQQYTQMLAKGKVDLDSWYTLQETMPYALRKTAEAFGFTGESATNDFYQAIKNGEITMAEFNAKLIELDQAQGGFAETAQTASAGIKTAWTNMKTWFVMGVADILSAIDDALGGTGSLQNAIESLKPIVLGTFGWIADVAIPAVAEGVRWLIDRFNEFKPTLEATKNALQPLLDVFMQTASNIKEQLIPFLESVMSVLESLWPVIQLVGAVVGTSLLVTLFALTTVLNGLYNAIIPIITAFWNLADMVINVFNAIIAVLTGDFDAALEYWNKAVESAVSFFENIWQGIVGFFEGIVDAILGWFGILSDDAQAKVIEMKDRIVGFFVNLKDESINKAKEFATGIKNRFEDMKRNAINKVIEAKNNVVNRFNELKTQAVNKVNEFKNNIKNKFDETKREMVNKAKQAVTDTISKIGELPGKIRQKATEFFNAGKRIVTSIADGIKSAISKVTGAISDVASKVRDFLPFSPAKEGPLKDLDKLNFGGTIGDAIAKGRNKALKSMKSLADDLADVTDIDLLGELRGMDANLALAGSLPSGYATQQQIINNQVNAKRYDDSTVVQLLKQLVDKDGNVYINRDKVGSIMDEEQARRIKALERRVAID